MVLDQPQDIKDLQQYLGDKEIIAYDSETTGLTARHEVIGYSVCAEEDKASYVILAYWDREKQTLVYLRENMEASIPLLRSLQGKSLIMHNAVFDCMMAKSYFKVDLMPSVHTDTMILAHLLDENRPVGLKTLGSLLFGESSTKEQKEMIDSIIANGGQATKTNYELYKADAQLIGKYGAKDTILTYKLFMHLVPDLYEQGLEDFFYEDESMPLLRGPTYELNTVGLTVDSSRLLTLKKTLQAECLEAKEFIHREIASYIKEKYPGTNKKNAFNIGASQQLSWLLFGQLNLEFSTLTKGGKAVAKTLGLKHYSPAEKRNFIATCLREKGTIIAPEGYVNGKLARAKTLKDPWGYIACDKDTLKKLSHKYAFIERLLEYQRKMKLLSTYVEGIEERTQYGTIQPSFLQHGTTSGRYASRAPNFQNLPRDDKRIKECIVARPDCVFVGADQSQLEPRVFAYQSGDANLMAAFIGTDDFYSVIGMRVYDKYDCTPNKDGSPEAFGLKYKKLRDLSKVIALASTYGATAHQLMKTTGKSADDTQQDIDRYFEEFPDVAQMMLDSHAEAKKNGRVTNLFGRPRRIPEATSIDRIYGPRPHAELPYEIRSLLNLAVNHKIQSTGASIVNRGAIKFYRDVRAAGLSARIVLQVHDSLVAECPADQADDVAIILQNALETAVELKGVPLEAIPKIGHNLAEV